MLVVWFLWLCFYCLCIVSWPPCICLRLALCPNTKMKCEGFILIYLFIYKMSKIRKSKMGKWTISHQLTKTGQEKIRKTVHSLHSQQIPVQQSTSGMWVKWKFGQAADKSTSVMLSCQRRAQSPRNVSTLKQLWTRYYQGVLNKVVN